MRRSLGIAVFSGMLGVTLFGIFLDAGFLLRHPGLGESRLFASGGHRWRFVSRSLGGRLRLAGGFSVREAGRSPRAPLGGDRRRRRGRC